MSVSSICSSFTAERDLAHPDLEVRESAVRYVRELADLASAVGAPLIIIASTAFLRNRLKSLMSEPISSPLGGS